MVLPDHPAHAGVYLEVVQPDHPTFPTLGLATFDQPPFSFLLPSWDLMIPHGSGQRMTRKHSSSPVVAVGNSGGKTPRLDESTALHPDYTDYRMRYVDRISDD